MNQPKPNQCETWEDFKSLVTKKFINGGTEVRWLFRGQAVASWKLVSTFDRIHPDLESKVKNYISLTTLFREQIKKTILMEASILNNNIEIQSHKDLMSLAQHHGLPTRLLDWSVSPYVAAFFAFEASLKLSNDEFDEAINERVAVWVLDRSIDDVWNEELGASIWEASTVGNIRAFNQGGWFSELRSTHKCLEEYVASFGIDADQNTLFKITIPRSEAERALADLRLMNITSTILFPGFDGIARDAFLQWSLLNR